MKIKIIFVTLLELMINKSLFLSNTIFAIGFNMLLSGMCFKSGQCIYRHLLSFYLIQWQLSS